MYYKQVSLFSVLILIYHINTYISLLVKKRIFEKLCLR